MNKETSTLRIPLSLIKTSLILVYIKKKGLVFRVFHYMEYQSMIKETHEYVNPILLETHVLVYLQ